MTSDPISQTPDERLLVSVLFIDLIGFSALADQLDPGAARDVMGALWDELLQIIKEHGGYVAQQLSSSLMVVWGAPESQEDDAEQAVLASLALLDGLAKYKEAVKHPAAKSLRMRMGLHTGLALAGHIGVQGEYVILGETIRLAKLMEEAGHPGMVVASEATYQAIRGAFQVKRLGPIQLEGTKALMNIFQILDELPQPTKLRYRSKGGLETILVGRSREMDQLAELFISTQEKNQPHLALVTGDVGVGKSRLLFEFAGHLETENPLLTVMSSRALEQTSQVPYHLWKELWFNRFELKEDDSPEIAQKKAIDGVLTLWGRALGEVTSVEVAHFLGSMIGVGWENSRYLEPYQNKARERMERAYQLMIELLKRASQRGPIVMILDDLQWADPGSLALLKHIWGASQEGLPLLILCSARPEFLETSGEGFAGVDLIDLRPLAVDPAVVRQAYPILKNEDEELLSILADKAQGNPYYLEEMVKAVVVSGRVDEKKVFNLPETLEGLLRSRLDSLTLEGRATAYFASVAGRAFWKGSVMAAFRGAPGVTQVLDVSSHNLVGKVQRALDELMEKELAFLRVGSAFAGDREYIFKHSLLHDVAYHKLPEDLRAACHLAVAAWLADRAGPERSISVARHYEKAGVNDRAQEFYTLAAEHARSLGRDEEADDIQYYARTLPGENFR